MTVSSRMTVSLCAGFVSGGRGICICGMYGFGSIVDGEIEDTDVNDVTDDEDADERIEGREPPDC